MPGSVDEAIKAADAVVSAATGTVGQRPAVARQSRPHGRLDPSTVVRRRVGRSGSGTGIKSSVGTCGTALRDRPSRTKDPGKLMEPARNMIRARFGYSGRTAGELRRKMRGEPEDWRRPKSGKENLAKRYWQQRSHLLIAARCNVVSGRLTAIWSPIPSVGSAWTPVSVSDQDTRQGAGGMVELDACPTDAPEPKVQGRSLTPLGPSHSFDRSAHLSRTTRHGTR